jgi:hypothetical protein
LRGKIFNDIFINLVRMSAEPESTTVSATAAEPIPPRILEEEKPASAPVEAAVAKKEVRVVSPPGTNLSLLFAELPAILKEADYQEMWGITLTDESHVPSAIVLEKFLRANAKDVLKAKTQLTEALKWRKRVQPNQILAETEFDAAKFGKLGYVMVYPGSGVKEIVTFNIYGAVKDNKATFGNVEEYFTPFPFPTYHV